MSLDKKGRLEKKRSDAEDARIVEAEKLNPSLPYKMAIFPYDFFGIENLFPTEDEEEKS